MAQQKYYVVQEISDGSEYYFKEEYGWLVSTKKESASKYTKQEASDVAHSLFKCSVCGQCDHCRFYIKAVR